MSSSGAGPTAQQEPPPAPNPPTGPQPPQQPQELAGWQTIDEQRDFYDERDCLHPSYLASEKLQTREENDVVIFDYSLDPGYLSRADGNPQVDEGSPSSGHPSSGGDRFFRVSGDELTSLEKFDQIIKPQLILSSGPRLGIIDFPQCHGEYDGLLSSMVEKLGLQEESDTTFMDANSPRVRALPGRGRFRTGVSLRAPFKEPSVLPGSGSSEDRFTLFVSFPYFGESSKKGRLGLQRESIKPLEFKRLGGGVRGRRAAVGGGRSDDIGEILVEEGEILVHQARYMIFDNYTMATFRSKEDSARGQVPLHRFQERVGAFRAMVHMIANRMDSELWILWKLRDSLCQLEEDIDQMISDAEEYEGSQGMMEISDDEPLQVELPPRVNFTKEEESKWEVERDQARQNKIQKRKQKRVRGLLTALNSLSADLFAAISVAERQIAVLQDLHSVFLTSYRTKTKHHERGYPLQQNPLHKNAVTIPILSENPEQIWPNTLDTIDEVVRERKSFIKEVKELVENMDIRRKILSTFLKSDQAKAAPSERTAQEAKEAMKRTEKIIEETQAQLVQQGQTLTGFTVVTTAFLPLGFCTSYFGMQTIKEFGGPTPQMSVRKFWLTSGPVLAAILLLTVVIVLWKRPLAKDFRTSVKEKLGLSETGRAKDQRLMTGNPKRHFKKRFPWSHGEKIGDPETPNSEGQAPARPSSQEQTLAGLSPPRPGTGEGGG